MECLAFKVGIGIIPPLNPSVTTELNYSTKPPAHLSAPERVVGHGEAVDRVVNPRLPGHAVSEPVQPLVILSPAPLAASLTSSLASHNSPDVSNSLAASKALTRSLPLVAPSIISVWVPASAPRGVLRQLAVSQGEQTRHWKPGKSPCVVRIEEKWIITQSECYKKGISFLKLCWWPSYLSETAAGPCGCLLYTEHCIVVGVVVPAAVLLLSHCCYLTSPDNQKFHNNFHMEPAGHCLR